MQTMTTRVLWLYLGDISLVQSNSQYLMPTFRTTDPPSFSGQICSNLIHIFSLNSTFSCCKSVPHPLLPSSVAE